MDTKPLSDLLAQRQPKPPTYPVVYFLFKEDTLVYVGQTRDIARRLSLHRSRGTDYDSYTTVSAQDLTVWQRRDLEAAYIRALQPSTNVAHSGVKGRRVAGGNLPKRSRGYFEPNEEAARDLWRLLNPGKRIPQDPKF